MNIHKKVMKCLLLILAGSTSLLSASFSECLSGAENRFEIRGAAFAPSSTLCRKEFGNVCAFVQIENTTRFKNDFGIWVGLDCMSNSKGIRLNDPSIVNLNLGFKYIYYIGYSYSFYVGLGPNLSKVSLKESSCKKHRHEENNKEIWGLLGKVGLFYDFTDYVFLDIFVDYVYQPTYFHSRSNNDGIKAGLGLGVIY